MDLRRTLHGLVMALLLLTILPLPAVATVKSATKQEIKSALAKAMGSPTLRNAFVPFNKPTPKVVVAKPQKKTPPKPSLTALHKRELAARLAAARLAAARLAAAKRPARPAHPIAPKAAAPILEEVAMAAPTVAVAEAPAEKKHLDPAKRYSRYLLPHPDGESVIRVDWPKIKGVWNDEKLPVVRELHAGWEYAFNPVTPSPERPYAGQTCAQIYETARARGVDLNNYQPDPLNDDRNKVMLVASSAWPAAVFMLPFTGLGHHLEGKRIQKAEFEITKMQEAMAKMHCFEGRW